MVRIKDKHNCCGCESCVQTCPKHCITMQQDEEGFLYPIVHEVDCINCHLCEHVCPVINQNPQADILKVWAAQNTNDEIRKKSSSGGVASLIAENIINRGGAVFGARFNESWDVVHACAETHNQLTAFRGSKYVQSKIGNSFIHVENLLKADRNVLFIGTPCQVAGLKCFLRREYENLITVDFICHGVPSPSIFKWYLQEEILKYVEPGDYKNNIIGYYQMLNNDFHLPDHVKIMDIQFRNKQDGWKKYSLVLQLSISSTNGKNSEVFISNNVTKDLFLKGFTSDLYLRPSCHKCPSRNFRSGSDLTIGDFWGQEQMFPEFDNDTGVSCIIVKTLKGDELIDKIKQIKKEVKTIGQALAYNPSLIISKAESYNRKKFWKYIGKYSFEDSVNRALHLNIAERAMLKIKNKFKK